MSRYPDWVSGFCILGQEAVRATATIKATTEVLHCAQNDDVAGDDAAGRFEEMAMATTMVSPVGFGVGSVAGRFGKYGGRYVPETLMAALLELEQAYAEAQADPAFAAELADLLHHYCGRPTPLVLCEAADGGSAAGRRST